MYLSLDPAILLVIIYPTDKLLFYILVTDAVSALPISLRYTTLSQGLSDVEYLPQLFHP